MGKETSRGRGFNSHLTQPHSPSLSLSIYESSAYTAAKNPNLCRGLILVNTAGRLVEDTAELPFQESSVTEEDSPLEAARKTVVAEIGSRLIFKYLEGNVPSLLEKAYTNVPARADSKLVREIERASSDPGAFDVFKSVFYLPAPTPLSSLIKEYPGDGEPWPASIPLSFSRDLFS